MSAPLDPPPLGAADGTARELLGHLPDPAPGAELRVRHAVRTSLATPRPRYVRWVVASGAVAAVAAAAAWALLPPPTPPSAPLVARALESRDAWRSEPLLDEVSLSFSGTGAASGTTDAPRIDWDRGTLNVEVVPNQGIHLTVATREAEVRVVGTGFSVVRDALGTHVAVLHGKVAVTCVSGESDTLEGGASITCLPTSPAALLGRANALLEQGAPAEQVLGTLDRALALAAPGPVADELRVRRVEALVRADRAGDALAAARAYLDSGATLRRTEMLRVASNLSYSAGGCARAARDLAALGAAPDATPEDRARLAACASSP